MSKLNYTEHRDMLVNNFTRELHVRKDDYINGQFQMVSAGLLNYLPDIPVEKHEEIFKQILLHKKLSILEQADYEVLNYVQTEGLTDDVLSLLKNKPVVICTFHTGSYRVLNLFLCRHKIPYTLVMGKEVIKKEGPLLSTLFQRLPGNTATENLHIIDAEAANSGLQMLRELKRGRCLLLYIDGNTGAGATTIKNENCCAVNFLHQQLYARKGIAFLAHAAHVPLLTVASYRKSWERIYLKFFEPVFPDVKEVREDFAIKTTQLIYDQVAPLIIRYPEQWEAWLYIHKVAHIINIPFHKQEEIQAASAFQKLYFNSARFGIFKLHGKPFLLKKHTYSFYEITTQLYDVLTRSTDTAIDKSCLNQEQFQQLQQEGVIAYA
jgi:lauroyl/myristoyl acyltransferase